MADNYPVINVPVATIARWMSTLPRGVWNTDASVYGDVYITRDINPRALVCPPHEARVYEAREIS